MLGKWPGLILEEGMKRRLGFHDGYWFHTIGQRTGASFCVSQRTHFVLLGLKLAGGPWYVTRKDTVWNVVYVSRFTSTISTGLLDTFLCRNATWLNTEPEYTDMNCKVSFFV